MIMPIICLELILICYVASVLTEIKIGTLSTEARLLKSMAIIVGELKQKVEASGGNLEVIAHAQTDALKEIADSVMFTEKGKFLERQHDARKEENSDGRRTAKNFNQT